MFNIESSVRLLMTAEKINNSRNLTDAEKLHLLQQLQDSIMVEMPGCPEHAKIIHASIDRMTRNERDSLAKRAEEQGRKAKGVEKQAQVDIGRAEEAAQEVPRTPEGVTEPAQDVGPVDSPKPDTRPYASKRHKRKA
jgi:hypothetical protein